MSQKAGKFVDIKLYNNPRERETYDNLADLFAIIKTTEALEKAYVRDAITQQEYKENCSKLITQFQAALTLSKEAVPDIKKFIQDYRLDNCKAAYKRLLEDKVPLAGGKIDDSAKTVAETVQHFITSMDLIRLGKNAVDELQPVLQDLQDSLAKVSVLPPDWEGKEKLKSWLSLLRTMKASDKLEEDQIRQIMFDLENAYSKFHKSLSNL